MIELIAKALSYWLFGADINIIAKCLIQMLVWDLDWVELVF